MDDDQLDDTLKRAFGSVDDAGFSASVMMRLRRRRRLRALLLGGAGIVGLGAGLPGILAAAGGLARLPFDRLLPDSAVAALVPDSLLTSVVLAALIVGAWLIPVVAESD